MLILSMLLISFVCGLYMLDDVLVILCLNVVDLVGVYVSMLCFSCNCILFCLGISCVRSCCFLYDFNWWCCGSNRRLYFFYFYRLGDYFCPVVPVGLCVS